MEQVIHPLTTEVIARGLDQARRDGADAVLIRLNTPGGLMTAMQEIIQKIVASPVPVITFVAPSGGRAASAGFFLLEAGDVAAMAPATNTGAAHPVVLGGSQLDPVLKQKIENDAAASVRAGGNRRGFDSLPPHRHQLAQRPARRSAVHVEGVGLDPVDLAAERDGDRRREAVGGHGTSRVRR